MRSTISYSFLLPLLATTQAFTPSASSRSQPDTLSREKTPLHLLPEQGNQLAAACAASYVKKEAKEEIKTSPINPTQAAREFVSRVFNLPSQRHTNDNTIFDGKSDRENVVDYPVVGMTFVQVDGQTRVLPSANAYGAAGAINIQARREAITEPTFGWFSPACALGNPFADHEEYCGNHKKEELADEKKAMESRP